MSDTPRTDNAEAWATERPRPVDSISSFARTLERENATLRDALEEITFAGHINWARKRATQALNAKPL
jgi:hypothetical protein